MGTILVYRKNYFLNLYYDVVSMDFSKASRRSINACLLEGLYTNRNV